MKIKKTKNTKINRSQNDNGWIIEIVGPVVNVQFPHKQLPKIYDALKIEVDKNKYLILEFLEMML